MTRIVDKELDRSARVIKSKLSTLCSLYGERDVAEWSRSSVHMIRKYRNISESQYQMPAANLRLLSKNLTSVMDDTILEDFTDSGQCVSLTAPGESNGCVDDDLKELLKAAGEAASCFDTGDKEGYALSMKDLKSALKNMTEEGKGL